MSDEKNNDQYQPVIPRAVREQAERADQIARELGVANTPGLEEYRAEQAQDDTTVVNEEHLTPELHTSEPPQETWEQRYRTLQGKYDGEVQSLRGQVTQLQSLLATMQSAPAQQTPQYQPPAERYSPRVSEEDRQVWGDDLPEAVTRWAEGSMGERLRQIEYENQQLREQLNGVAQAQGQTQTNIAQQQVMTALDRDPDIGDRWRTLNSDDGFLAWLNQPDPFSGQMRMNLLRDAYAQGDVFRTGQFFRSYLTGHTAPSGGMIRTQTGANGTYRNGSDRASAGNVNLASLVAPGRSSVSGNSGASPEKRNWTNQEIGAFYRDVNRGMYRGRDAEKLNIETDIIAAAREGRVFSN
jgi:hypothetical protein